MLTRLMLSPLVLRSGYASSFALRIRWQIVWFLVFSNVEISFSCLQSLSHIMDVSMEDLARCPGIGERKVFSVDLFSF